jgi:hypothetical protein
MRNSFFLCTLNKKPSMDAPLRGFYNKKGVTVETITRCELSKDFWLVVGLNKISFWSSD